MKIVLDGRYIASKLVNTSTIFSTDNEGDKMNEVLRRDLIKWLEWNDRNGCYSDEDSLREFGEVMTIQEALQAVSEQIEG